MPFLGEVISVRPPAPCQRRAATPLGSRLTCPSPSEKLPASDRPPDQRRAATPLGSRLTCRRAGTPQAPHFAADRASCKVAKGSPQRPTGEPARRRLRTSPLTGGGLQGREGKPPASDRLFRLPVALCRSVLRCDKPPHSLFEVCVRASQFTILFHFSANFLPIFCQFLGCTRCTISQNAYFAKLPVVSNYGLQWLIRSCYLVGCNPLTIQVTTRSSHILVDRLPCAVRSRLETVWKNIPIVLCNPNKCRPHSDRQPKLLCTDHQMVALKLFLPHSHRIPNRQISHGGNNNNQPVLRPHLSQYRCHTIYCVPHIVTPYI